MQELKRHRNKESRNNSYRIKKETMLAHDLLNDTVPICFNLKKKATMLSLTRNKAYYMQKLYTYSFGKLCYFWGRCWVYLHVNRNFSSNWQLPTKKSCRF